MNFIKNNYLGKIFQSYLPFRVRANLLHKILCFLGCTLHVGCQWVKFLPGINWGIISSTLISTGVDNKGKQRSYDPDLPESTARFLFIFTNLNPGLPPGLTGVRRKGLGEEEVTNEAAYKKTATLFPNIPFLPQRLILQIHIARKG